MMPFAHDWQPHQRLRIGYISPDFRAHAMGRLLCDLFQHHDRARFEVYGYAIMSSPPKDPFQEKFRAGCDVFREIWQKGILESAQIIHQDEIDILIDLSGYTMLSKPGILALRPARIQISYLGYPNMTQASFYDYLLADKHIIPKEIEPYYSEKILRLPHTFIGAAVEKPDLKRSRKELGVPAQAVVLAAFHRPEKITPDLFAAWMKILQAAPEAVLWLSGNEQVATNLRAYAQAYDIAQERLIFAPWADYELFLYQMSQADFFLDTWYYSAGATAVAAINMGLPVLTYSPAAHFTARMGESICAAAGLEEGIAVSETDYIQKAVDWIKQPDLLRGLAKKIQSPEALSLFNNRNFAKALEALYQSVIQI
ncbi:MAG: hypothetical protein HC912_05125 [Saprospiraceae bacterium]|nr:hypothetical protein [Saprospiraceae bacterium]